MEEKSILFTYGGVRRFVERISKLIDRKISEPEIDDVPEIDDFHRTKLVVDEYTNVLMHFDESVRKDECNNSLSIEGNPTIKDEALYLDSSSWLSFDEGVSLGAADFTIEFLFKLDSDAPQNYSRAFEFNDEKATKTNVIFMGYCGDSAGSLWIRVGNDAKAFAVSKSIEYHFALVYRHALQKTLVFVNGAKAVELSGEVKRVARPFAYIGHGTWEKEGNWKGFISEFRISDGIARWTENFTPVDKYTKVLLSFDEFANEDKCGNTWAVIGTPSVSNGALQLDGNSYLQLEKGIMLGGQDFSIDFWCKINSNRSGREFNRAFEFSDVSGQKSRNTILMAYAEGNKAWFRVGGSTDSASDFFCRQGVNMTPDEKHHIAFVYQHAEGKTSVFVDGRKVYAFNGILARVNHSVAYIGHPSFADENNWEGIIDEFRVSDGIARWTDDSFEVPALAYE